MENATKALLMAGGLLISILLISFMVFVLRKGASASAEYYTTMSDTELAEFNSQFEVYDRDNNTYFDVITVANLAYDINKKNDYDETNAVIVEVEIDENRYLLQNSDSLEKGKFLLNGVSSGQYDMYDLVLENSEKKDNSNEYKYYFTCTKISYNSTTGKVNEMKFKRYKNE